MPLTNAEAAEFEMKAAGEDARGEWKDGSFFCSNSIAFGVACMNAMRG
jgi:hypothetical protein